jgi:hypothetical protein
MTLSRPGSVVKHATTLRPAADGTITTTMTLWPWASEPTNEADQQGRRPGW